MKFVITFEDLDIGQPKVKTFKNQPCPTGFTWQKLEIWAPRYFSDISSQTISKLASLEINVTYCPLVEERIGETEIFNSVREIFDACKEICVTLMKKSSERFG